MLSSGKTIGIDALPILADYAQGAGISKFMVNLLQDVVRSDKKNQYVLFFRSFRKTKIDLDNLEKNLPVNVSIRSIYLPDRLQLACWKFKTLSSILELLFYPDIDLYISTTYFTPRFRRTKIISFIYDLTPLKSPVVTQDHSLQFERILGIAIARSEILLTISEYSKKDIISNFSISPHKVHVVYPTISSRFKPSINIDISKITGSYGIKMPYILSVGVRGRNKNLITALKAFHVAVRQYQIPHQMVLVGRSDRSNETDNELVAFISAKGISDRVVFTGYVPDQDLPALYSGADVFVFPSFYEGFGMPILEAMACGTPVVASNTSSIPEVTGGAALLFDPIDVTGISNAIISVIRNRNLAKNLREKGLIQCTKFSHFRGSDRFLTIIKTV